MVKKIHLSVVFIALLLVTTSSSGQVIFNENFGASTVRLTSPFMPAGSYTWADPNGSTIGERQILDNHYAVIAPAHIRDAWPVPAWWWWTGPEPIGNTYGGAGAPATDDHTGNTNGAVLVVNAGTVLNTFYNRVATLTPSRSYRISFWMYLVSASSQVELKIRDVGTNAVLGSISTGYVSNLYTWTEYSYNFRLPPGCPSNHIRITLENGVSLINGNDYYIDDIVLEELPGATEPDIICPTSPLLPVHLTDFGLIEVTSNNIHLQWKTDQEYNILRYEIERSVDGKNFNSIGSIPAKNQLHPAKYLYNDQQLLPGFSNFYYRLKTVEEDGQFKYSKIVVASTNTKFGITVFPQPSANGSVQVWWKETGLFTIRVFSADLKLEQSWNNYSGNRLTIHNLTKGIHIVSILSKKGEISTVKLLVE